MGPQEVGRDGGVHLDHHHHHHHEVDRDGGVHGEHHHHHHHEVDRDGGVHLDHHHHLYPDRIHAFPHEVDSDVGVHTNHHNSPPHCHCIRAFLAFFSCFTHPSNPIFMNILVTVLLFYATF